MATIAPNHVLTGFKAGADLSTKQFYLVKISAANTVDVCAATSDIPIGVLNNAPGLGGACEIIRGGEAKVKLGGTVAAGAFVGTHSDGTAVAKTADKDYVAGQAREGGSSGEIATVILNFGHMAA